MAFGSFFVLSFLIAASLASAQLTDEIGATHRRLGWKLHSCDAAGTNATLGAPLRFYLDWGRGVPPATSASVAVGDDLEALKAHVAPTPATVDAAWQSPLVKPIREHCQQAAFDRIDCTGVPVSTWSAVLRRVDASLTLCEFSKAALSETVRLTAPFARVWRTTAPLALTGTPFTLVDGVVLGNVSHLPPRRHRQGRHGSLSHRQNFENNRAASFEAAAPGPQAWPENPSHSPAAFALGAEFSSALYAPGAGHDAYSRIVGFYVVLRCRDGSWAQMGHGRNDYTRWCAASGSTAPHTVTFTNLRTNATTAYSVQNDPEGDCASASSQQVAPPGASEAESDAVTCAISLKRAFADDPLWSASELQVTVAFGDGASFVSSPTTFYAGTEGGLPVTFTVSRPLTPVDLRALYGVPPHVPARVSSNLSIGILEFTTTDAPGSGVKYSDVLSFLNADREALGLPKYTESDLRQTLQYVGYDSTTIPSGESTLDIEWAMAFSPDARTWVWNVANGPHVAEATYAEAFTKWSSDALSLTGAMAQHPPTVWSISYAGPEWPGVEPNGAQLSDVLNRNFALLSAAGVTAVAASGDWGAVWDIGDEAFALFPASSPGVFAVGGTALLRSSATGDVVTQVACEATQGNEITSGGGFSLNFDVPEYQRAVVSGYVSRQSNSTAKRFRPTKRAIPDVASIATQFKIVQDSEESVIYGTSGAAPTVAGILNHLARLRAASSSASVASGPGGISHVHELVYSAVDRAAGSVIAQDVTLGSNCPGEQYGWAIANTPTYAPDNCYSAVSGWDPVTGLGTLNATVLYAILP